MEITPLERLVYSWKGGTSKNNLTLDTIVEWTLEPKENGTELSLIHSGFKDMNALILTAMYDGWNKNIEKMINHLKSD